jgi:hypothetical protein
MVLPVSGYLIYQKRWEAFSNLDFGLVPGLSLSVAAAISTKSEFPSSPMHRSEPRDGSFQVGRKLSEDAAFSRGLSGIEKWGVDVDSMFDLDPW